MNKRFSNISVVGLGYVGLPLSLQFSRSGVNVLGLDVDSKKVESINSGKSYLKHFSSDDIKGTANLLKSLKQQIILHVYRKWKLF